MKEANVESGAWRVRFWNLCFPGAKAAGLGVSRSAVAMESFSASSAALSNSVSTTSCSVRYHGCHRIDDFTSLATGASTSWREKAYIKYNINQNDLMNSRCEHHIIMTSISTWLSSYKHMCCHSWRSRWGATTDKRAWRYQGPWNSAMRSIPFNMLGVSRPVGRTSPTSASFMMYKQLAGKRAWCKAPGARIR